MNDGILSRLFTFSPAQERKAKDTYDNVVIVTDRRVSKIFEAENFSNNIISRYLFQGIVGNVIMLNGKNLEAKVANFGLIS